jgi:hypothetical protein
VLPGRRGITHNDASGAASSCWLRRSQQGTAAALCPGELVDRCESMVGAHVCIVWVLAGCVYLWQHLPPGCNATRVARLHASPGAHATCWVLYCCFSETTDAAPAALAWPRLAHKSGSQAARMSYTLARRHPAECGSRGARSSLSHWMPRGSTLLRVYNMPRVSCPLAACATSCSPSNNSHRGRSVYRSPMSTLLSSIHFQVNRIVGVHVHAFAQLCM